MSILQHEVLICAQVVVDEWEDGPEEQRHIKERHSNNTYKHEQDQLVCPIKDSPKPLEDVNAFDATSTVASLADLLGWEVHG